MDQGLFITLEGIEGAGKSSNLEYIEVLLKRRGREVVVTREPGGTELGERIRALLLDTSGIEFSTDTETLLMFAARADHIQRVIRPALAQGKIVVCDRFTDATYAYQGAGRGVGSQRVAVLEDWVQADLRPHLTLLFDVTAAAGLQRAGRRSDPDRFERENQQFFDAARQAYLDIAAREPERVKLIDANANLVKVREQISDIFQTFFNNS